MAGTNEPSVTYPIVRSYKDLIVWKKAIDLTVEIYRLAEGFPPCRGAGPHQPDQTRGGVSA
jgi:hypothetical protein